MNENATVLQLPKKERKKRGSNRAKCQSCSTVVPFHTADCATFKQAPKSEEHRAQNEALAARVELVREMVKACRAALLQAEAQLDEIELGLTP